MLQEDYFNTKEFRDTLALYEQARNERRTLFLDASDLTDVAEYYYTKQLRSQAMEALEHALYLYPHATLPLTYKARMVLWEESNVGKALQLLSLCDDKTYPEYHYTEAEIMIADERDDEAQRSLQRYVDCFDDAEHISAVHDVLALLLDYNAYALAERWLNESTTLKDTPEYTELAGACALMQGDYQRARQLLEKAVEHDPFNVVAWQNLSRCCMEENNFPRAVEAANFALAIEADNEEMQYIKACCFFEQQNYRDALPLFQRLSELHPEKLDFNYPIIVCLAKEGRDEEAKDMVKKAMEVTTIESPFAPEFFKMLADLSEETGEMKAAEEIRKLQYKAEAYRASLYGDDEDINSQTT